MKKHTKMLLLAVFCVWATHTNAQTQLSKIKNTDKGQQAQSLNNPEAFKVNLLNSGLTLSNGKTTTTICKDGKIDAATIIGNEVYYLKNGSTIQIYDIKNKTTKDLLQNSNAGNVYHVDNKIDKMIVDKNNNRVYFSTNRTNANGHKEALCWHYDITSGNLTLYRDGSLESIDAAGNQTIAFEGKDSRGAFVSRTIVNANGKIISNLGKSYTQLSNK